MLSSWQQPAKHATLYSELRQKSERRSSWQRGKHIKLYPDLLQTGRADTGMAEFRVKLVKVQHTVCPSPGLTVTVIGMIPSFLKSHEYYFNSPVKIIF